MSRNEHCQRSMKEPVSRLLAVPTAGVTSLAPTGPEPSLSPSFPSLIYCCGTERHGRAVDFLLGLHAVVVAAAVLLTQSAGVWGWGGGGEIVKKCIDPTRAAIVLPGLSEQQPLTSLLSVRPACQSMMHCVSPLQIINQHLIIILLLLFIVLYSSSSSSSILLLLWWCSSSSSSLVFIILPLKL